MEITNQMAVKRIINKEDYPMVTDWCGYKNTQTLLPCECEGCGKIIFKNINKLDQEKSCFCFKCSITIKRKKTNIEKYGVEHTLQSKKVREKIKETVFEKYGVKNVAQNTKVKEKIKETTFKRYGVENVMQSEKIKKKQKKR